MVVNCVDAIWAGVTRCSCFYCWQWGKIWCCVPRSDSQATDVKTQRSCLWKRHLKKNKIKQLRRKDVFSRNSANVARCNRIIIFPGGLSTIVLFASLSPLGRPAPKRISFVDEAFGQSERVLDSAIGSLCAVDNDLINGSISIEARPCLATLDLSQPRFPARGKNSFRIPSALPAIRCVHCHCARKTDLPQRTLISVYSASGHHVLTGRERVNTLKKKFIIKYLISARWLFCNLAVHSQTHCCFSLSRQKNACIYWPWKDGHRFVPSEEMSLLVISIGEPPPFGSG